MPEHLDLGGNITVVKELYTNNPYETDCEMCEHIIDNFMFGKGCIDEKNCYVYGGWQAAQQMVLCPDTKKYHSLNELTGEENFAYRFEKGVVDGYADFLYMLHIEPKMKFYPDYICDCKCEGMYEGRCRGGCQPECKCFERFGRIEAHVMHLNGGSYGSLMNMVHVFYKDR